MLRFIKWLRIVIASVIIAFAVLINIARFTVPLLNSHSVFFEKWASEALHEPVHISQVTAGWYGLDPAFNFKNVEIKDPENQQTVLKISRLSIGINLLQSLLHWRLLPTHLLLAGTHLDIEQTADGQFHLQGMPNLQGSLSDHTKEQIKKVFLWALTQANISIKHIHINYRANNGETISLDDFQLQVINDVIHHQVAGVVRIAQNIPTGIRFVLNLKDVTLDKFPSSADLYVEANPIWLQQWFVNQYIHQYVPSLKDWQILQGQMHLRIWAKWRANQLDSVQSEIEGQNVAVTQHLATKENDSRNLKLGNVYANVYWQPSALKLQLASTNAYVMLPDWFHQALSINQFNVVAGWQQRDNTWQVNVPSFIFNDNNLQAQGRFSLTKTATSSAVINTQMQFNMQSVAALPKYLPMQGCKPSLCKWLSHAFLQGNLSNGHLVFQGALDQFPFENGQGKFDFSSDIDRVDLRYSAEWPVLQDIQGTLVAHNNQMQIVANTASTVGNPLNHVVADIDHLAAAPRLTVVGHAKTTLSQGMKFLRQSPLPVAQEMEGMIVSGPMDFDLNLMIPLDHAKEDTVSDGQITVPDANVQLPQWDLNLSQVKGVFKFHNHDLMASQVHANLYGMPLLANIATVSANKNQSTLQFSINGLMQMNKLQQKFDLPLLKYFRGEAHYQALLQLHGKDHTLPNQLSIVSDLSGLQSILPAPYDKSAAQTRALSLNINLYNQRPSQLEMHYGNDFSAAVDLAKKDAQWQLHSGEVHLGMGQAHFQTHPGLLVTAKLAHVDGAAWKKEFLSLEKDSTPGVANHSWLHQLNIRAVELAIDQLQWNQYNLSNIYLSMTPMNAGWTLTVENQMMMGSLLIPHDQQQAWRGNFTRLYLLSDKTASPTTASLDPRYLPSLNLNIDDFRYDQRDIGKIILKTSRVPIGMQINTLGVSSPLVNIQAVGTWLMINNEPQTSLYGQLASTDLGALLKNWQVTKVVVGGKGNAGFSLAWPGSPQQFTIANVTGDIKFDFRSGRVTHLSENAEFELGIGRLLNLFSLQSIPLLPLNLMHLTQKGFAFSLFNGDFHLANGNAMTKNTALVGPVAWVQVNGSIGFARKNYDLNLEVIPNMTSSLPLIVGLAGGPIAGAITWIADKILAHQVGKAAKVNYRITGSWDKPQIMKLPAPAKTQ